MARPRKPSAIKALEGNRSRRDIPPEPELQGFPSAEHADHSAEAHFRLIGGEFGACGVLKRADSPALAKLASLWEAYWVAFDACEFDLACKLSAAWDRAAGKLGIQVVDRSRLMRPPAEKPDETEERFFKTVG